MASLCCVQGSSRSPGVLPGSLLPFSSAFHAAAAVGLLNFVSDQVISLLNLLVVSHVLSRVSSSAGPRSACLPLASVHLPGYSPAPTSSISYPSRLYYAAVFLHVLLPFPLLTWHLIVGLVNASESFSTRFLFQCLQTFPGSSLFLLSVVMYLVQTSPVALLTPYAVVCLSFTSTALGIGTISYASPQHMLGAQQMVVKYINQ